MVDLSDTKVFPRGVEAPRQARQFLASVLAAGGVDGLLETAVLLVSELVTNAIIHTGSEEIVVDVAVTRTGVVRCTVIDRAPDGRPTVQPVDLTTIGGSGLAIVDKVATRWGVERDATTKAVWFELEER